MVSVRPQSDGAPMIPLTARQVVRQVAEGRVSFHPRPADAWVHVLTLFLHISLMTGSLFYYLEIKLDFVIRKPNMKHLQPKTTTAFVLNQLLVVLSSTDISD